MADEFTPNIVVRREIERKLRENYAKKAKAIEAQPIVAEARAPEASPTGPVLADRVRDDPRLLARMQVGVPIKPNPMVRLANPDEGEGARIRDVEVEEGTPAQVDEPVSQGDTEAVSYAPSVRRATRVRHRSNHAPNVSRSATQGEILRQVLPEPSPYAATMGAGKHGEQAYEEAMYRDPHDRLVEDATTTTPVTRHDDLRFHDTNNDGTGTSDKLILNDDGTVINDFQRLLRKFIRS